MIRTYHDFILRASDVSQDIYNINSFNVQLIQSPLGMLEADSRTIHKDLIRRLSQLNRRKLDFEEIVAIGETLSDILLGGEIGAILDQCLSEVVQPEQGLRLRLLLPLELATFPWEYMYRQRGGGEKDATGFLALDPRISITRQEILAPKRGRDNSPKIRRLLVAMASPVDSINLDLDQERENLTKAFQNSSTNIKLDFLEDATADGLGKKLREVVDILHFAGHGGFEEMGQGLSMGTVTGQGSIMLVDHKGKSVPMPADQLAVNLIGSDVQLVVLGACETGKRDAQNVWSGVVAAVLEADVPAAVAMQFSVWDDAAITFTHHFYQVLAAGLPLDYAVCEARRAVFNLCNPLRQHIDRSKYWRDWGVPVLYLQVEGDFTLPAITDVNQRNAVLLYYGGLNAYYRRDYDQALGYLYDAVEADPGFSDAWELIVHVQQSLSMQDLNYRKYDAAEQKLKKALDAAKQTDPLDARALAGRGMVFKSLAQVEGGRGNLEKAGELYAKAADFFEGAINLDTDDEAAHLGLGNVQHARGNLTTAIAAYSRAIDLNPKYTAAYHDLALVYTLMMEADKEHALDWCRRALVAWEHTYNLFAHDPSFPQDYDRQVILPQMAKLMDLCDSEEKEAASPPE